MSDPIAMECVDECIRLDAENKAQAAEIERLQGELEKWKKQVESEIRIWRRTQREIEKLEARLERIKRIVEGRNHMGLETFINKLDREMFPNLYSTAPHEDKPFNPLDHEQSK